MPRASGIDWRNASHHSKEIGWIQSQQPKLHARHQTRWSLEKWRIERSDLNPLRMQGLHSRSGSLCLSSLCTHCSFHHCFTWIESTHSLKDTWRCPWRAYAPRNVLYHRVALGQASTQPLRRGRQHSCQLLCLIWGCNACGCSAWGACRSSCRI